jgi:hypothetical protein
MALCLMGHTLTQAVAADNSQSIAPDNYMKSIQAPPTPPPTFLVSGTTVDKLLLFHTNQGPTACESTHEWHQKTYFLLSVI